MRLSICDKQGNVSPINNPLTIGLPVDFKSDSNKVSSNSGTGSAPFASMHLNNKDSNEEYTVTIDNSWTKTVTIKVVKKDELLKLFQSNNVKDNTSQETGECVQSLPANETPTFIPLNPTPSISSLLLVACLQFSLLYVVGVPFLNFLQKKVRIFFFSSSVEEKLEEDLKKKREKFDQTAINDHKKKPSSNPPVSSLFPLGKSEDKKSSNS